MISSTTMTATITAATVPIVVLLEEDCVSLVTTSAVAEASAAIGSTLISAVVARHFPDHYNTSMTSRNSQPKKKRRYWIWILVGAYIVFIFHNSAMIATASSALSYKVALFIARHLEHFGIGATNFPLFHHYIRKLAHFSEFAGLGILVAIACHMAPLLRNKTITFLLFLFAVPFADETIQRFYAGRSSQFSDMVIDASGFLAGGIFAFLCILIYYGVRNPDHHF